MIGGWALQDSPTHSLHCTSGREAVKGRGGKFHSLGYHSNLWLYTGKDCCHLIYNVCNLEACTHEMCTYTVVLAMLSYYAKWHSLNRFLYSPVLLNNKVLFSVVVDSWQLLALAVCLTK